MKHAGMTAEGAPFEVLAFGMGVAGRHV